VRRAWRDNIQVVEILDRNFTMSISGSDGSVMTINFIEGSVVDNVDASLFALFLEELIDVVLILSESAVGIDDSEGGSWAQFSDLFVEVPGSLSVEEVVSIDFVSEWEFRDVVVSISVVEVT
jgi:hypothetical protein